MPNGGQRGVKPLRRKDGHLAEDHAVEHAYASRKTCPISDESAPSASNRWQPVRVRRLHGRGRVSIFSANSLTLPSSFRHKARDFSSHRTSEHPRLLRDIRTFCLANAPACARAGRPVRKAAPHSKGADRSRSQRRGIDAAGQLGACAANRVSRMAVPRPHLPSHPRAPHRACGWFDGCT